MNSHVLFMTFERNSLMGPGIRGHSLKLSAISQSGIHMATDRRQDKQQRTQWHEGQRRVWISSSKTDLTHSLSCMCMCYELFLFEVVIISRVKVKNVRLRCSSKENFSVKSKTSRTYELHWDLSWSDPREISTFVEPCWQKIRMDQKWWRRTQRHVTETRSEDANLTVKCSVHDVNN